MKFSKPQKYHLIHFYLLYFFQVGAGAVFWPFLSNFLISKGVSATTLGTILASGVVAGLIGYNVLGYISDKIRRFDLIILFLYTTGFLCMAVIENTTAILVIFIAYMVYGFASTPIDGIIDTWTIESYQDNTIKRYFGIIRSGGSLGYSIAIITSGLLISNADHFQNIIPFSYAAGLLCIGYMLYMKANRNINKFYGAQKKEKQNLWGNIKELFAVKQYSFLLAICLLLHIPINIITLFTPYLFYSLGGGSRDQAIFAGLGAMFEIPFFFISSKLLSKYKTHFLILLSSFAVVIKILIFITADSPSMLLVASIFSTIEFAIFYPAIRFEVSKVAPEHLKTTAQTVISVFYSSIPQILASLIGGRMIEWIGVHSAFSIAFCGLILVIFVFAVYLFMSSRRKYS